MYKISRLDGDLVVLSRKYVDELQNLPSERLSSIKGLIKVRSVCPKGPPKAKLADSDPRTSAVPTVALDSLLKVTLEHELSR